MQEPFDVVLRSADEGIFTAELSGTGVEEHTASMHDRVWESAIIPMSNANFYTILKFLRSKERGADLGTNGKKPSHFDNLSPIDF